MDAAQLEDALDELQAHLFKLIAIRPVAVLDGCLAALAELNQSRTNDSSGFNDRRTKLLNLFARATLAASGAEDALTTPTPIDKLFSPSHSSQRRKDIALRMVRLLVHYPDILKLPQISFRLFGLLDTQLADSLYRNAGIAPKAQTFEKANALRDLVEKVERELDQTIEPLNNLESLEPFRAHYLKLINNGSARLIVHPFIPVELRSVELIAIIQATLDFTKVTGLDIVPAYRRTHQVLSDYMAQCDLAGTEYARRFARTIAERVHTIAKKHFETTPFSKPATLAIASSQKKYPLHATGTSIPISFLLSNTSDGYALDVRLRIRSVSDNLQLSTPNLSIGGLEPGETRVELVATVASPSDSALLELTADWKNADDTPNEVSDIVEIQAQREDVDWQSASITDPYSLSPVSTFDVLVGRETIISTLLSLATSPDVGSAFIRGQKRVGKTSIAKTLQTRLLELFPQDCVVTYLEAGDYIGADGTSTIQRLGKQLCRTICRADSRFKNIPIPAFNDALSPLTEFLEEVSDVAPHCRLLFILDEFDELPLDLYKRGPLGDAFFRTLRSVSNKSQFGFILVGSEKMEYVLSCQGDSLNKFVKVPVDYFDKESQWGAFVDLVRKPALAVLEYSDSAVACLHKWSAGNPYFAKLICRVVYQMMIDKRDSHVTEIEVERAANRTLVEIGSNSFQHFWQDGIIDPPPRGEEIAVRRAKVLLALAECVRNGETCSTDAIVARARSFALDDIAVGHDLRGFERRKVLESKDGVYNCKVLLFQQWLVAQGYYQILTTFIDQEAMQRARENDEILRIKEDELLSVVESWDVYAGRRVSVEQVLAWLKQFTTLEERSLMFRVLKAVRFYSTDQIRSKLKEAHGIVTRGTTWHRKQYEVAKRRDMIVSYLGGVGNSGAEYARRYGDENAIFPDNIVPLEIVGDLLKKRTEVSGVVLIDDFLGSGQTTAAQLEANVDQLNGLSDLVGGRLFLLIVCGLEEGMSRVQAVIAEKHLELSFHVLDVVKSAESVFGVDSRAFREENIRLRARDVAYKYGLELLPDWPLGYGNCEATVVLDNKIPNNCLPVLWAERKGWRPLFRRL